MKNKRFIWPSFASPNLRLRSGGWLYLLGFNLIVIALLLGIINIHSDYVNALPNNIIGNKPSIIESLKEVGLPFSFLVIGDSRAKATSEHLIRLVREKGEPAFMVMNGDFVWRPGIWHHRFFLTRMLNRVKPAFPVFLVAGNHDIINYDTSRIKDPERQATREFYEGLYGPRNCDFVYNNCLFILCDGDAKSPVDYLDYLKSVLSQKAAGKKYIFVFTHYPPRGLDASIKKACLPNEKEFFALMEQYRVSYCFFGHHHGYWRGERNGTTYIISGGGGARLEPHIPDKTHHLLRITVGDDKISEEKITSQAQSNLVNWFGQAAFIHIFPVIDSNGLTLYIILFVFLLDSGLALWLYMRASPKPHSDGLKVPE
ncbi:MAG: metallophosphoesterase [Planctomycetota bacterium]